MQLLLVFIFFWSVFFSLAKWSEAIGSIIKGDLGAWWNAIKMAIPYSVIWIDAFLRIFTPSHTGLW